MKIALLTTLTSLLENQRIEEEVRALGHDFKLVDLSGFSFEIKNGEFNSSVTRDLDFDVIILRGVFETLKTIGAIAGSLRERGVRVFDNSLIEQAYSIDKVVDLTKLSLGEVLVPDTFYARTFPEILGYAHSISYPRVFKSVRMGKGAGVYKVDSYGEFVELVSRVQGEGKEAKSFLLQDFIPYKHDLRVLTIGDHFFTMERIPKEGEFRANFSLGGSVATFSLDEEIRALVERARDAVGLSVSGVDVLIAQDGKKYILEVNHTPGMAGMEEATGENVTCIFVEYALKEAK
jgi:gamma-F420-2:alpha-L-glutamate ligase